MAKDLDYYNDLSEQLEKEINVYAKTLQGIDAVVNSPNFDFEKMTPTQKKDWQRFESFCEEEGFSKSDRIRGKSYPKVKITIEDRIRFLEEQKKLSDNMKFFTEELDKVENDRQLSDAQKAEIRREVYELYDINTPEYKKLYKKMKNEKLKKTAEELEEKMTATKKKISEIKKKNNFGSVVASAFGPVGHNVYNWFAKLHNNDLKLYKKSKFLNVLIKVGICLASIAALGFVPTVPVLAELAAIFSIGSVALTTYSIYKVAKKNAKEATIKKKKTTLKESWFRYRKSRGKGEVSRSKPLKFASASIQPTPQRQPVEQQQNGEDRERTFVYNQMPRVNVQIAPQRQPVAQQVAPSGFMLFPETEVMEGEQPKKTEKKVQNELGRNLSRDDLLNKLLSIQKIMPPSYYNETIIKDNMYEFIEIIGEYNGLSEKKRSEYRQQNISNIASCFFNYVGAVEVLSKNKQVDAEKCLKIIPRDLLSSVYNLVSREGIQQEINVEEEFERSSSR